MTEIAFMVREDWAQWGTAMQQSSDTVREWLGASRPVWVVGKPEKFDDRVRSADRETAVYISRSKSPGPVVGFDRIADVASHREATRLAVVALHPYEDRDCDALRDLVDDGRVGKAYVQIWARDDMVRHWLEGVGAIDLHAGSPTPAPDPLQVAACELMVNEEYNGLSTGNGKATVIQLLRSFAVEGYDLDADAWLRAYFAAGGSFRHAGSIKKFVREVRQGTRHRGAQRFKPEIVKILREQITSGDTPPERRVRGPR